MEQGLIHIYCGDGMYAPYFKDKVDKNGKKVTDENGEIVKGQVPNWEGFKFSVARLDTIDLVMVHI